MANDPVDASAESSGQPERRLSAHSNVLSAKRAGRFEPTSSYARHTSHIATRVTMSKIQHDRPGGDALSVLEDRSTPAFVVRT